MTALAFRLRTLVYRAHNPRWAFTPESGEGAARHGGRFNPPGLPALYTSRRPETAWLEAQQGFPFKPQPLTLCAYEVDCEAVVDLTVWRVLAALALDPADLACPWEDLYDRGLTPPTWTLANRLVSEGYAGALVPSFAPGADDDDVNVVFWQWRPSRPHRVRVIDDHGRLPRDDRSWQ